MEARGGGNDFKANTVVAIKLARAVDSMLMDKTEFDPEHLVMTLEHVAVRKDLAPVVKGSVL